ncbi:hypoxanthine phosphoribosyltransferase [Listeria sp. PSOL-1]|uniref:hypoxanthine phosphoribosyltransferase n=1 Tax=Listeria sp. PSOL-1 TaxID=1844999 RepID=UPI0013D718F1|nr:hypoxanthine phosphoribosyltransferase [Listeria sp. PSOL-1]
MEEFERKVNNYIFRHQLICPDEKLLIAVSGGADSLALLTFFVRKLGFSSANIAVVHVNHHLRPEADTEADFVKRVAKEYKLPYFEANLDVVELAKREKNGIEATAREARYQFFEKLMKEENFDKIVLAHHADDQIETILMRLVRGSSGLSLAGMQPIRKLNSGQAIRPFLAVSKAEIQTFCEKEKIAFCEDSSNTDEKYTRNRYRKHLLPFLINENPAVQEHFLRFSEEMTADFLYLENMAAEIFQRNLQIKDKEVWFDICEVKNSEIPLQRRVIHLLLKYLYRDKPKELTSRQIRQVQAILSGDNPSAVLHFACGLIIRRVYDRLACFYEEETEAVEFYHQMTINDRLTLSSGVELQIKQKSSVVQTAGLDGIIVNARACDLPIIIRNRLPGDKMTLKGTGGTKKLKDIFIDAKVPKHKRDELPIITDYSGKILWVPGVKKSNNDVMPSQNEKQYLIKYRSNLGGNHTMRNDIQKVLISEEEIQGKIKEMGAELTAEYAGRNPLVIGILKGATPFMSDLLKRVDTYLEMDFMDVSSYGNSTVSSGEVKIVKDLNTSVEGRDVLVVEDIIDSGRTLSYLVDLIKYRKAKSVKLVTLLDKPEGRNVDISADYVGFIVPNAFVVGYGLDYAERYRNLPYIGILKPEVYSE